MWLKGSIFKTGCSKCNLSRLYNIPFVNNPNIDLDKTDGKTTLFFSYNGRIDISHIVKTQEIIFINVKQSIVMTYSHVLIVILGKGAGGGGYYFLFPKSFKVFSGVGGIR